MANARVTRGRKTEDLLAAYYRDRGWPEAEAVVASQAGADIRKMPGLAPEVKARKGFQPLEWIMQARKNANGRMPFVILRCNGQGPESIGEWLVITRLADHVTLLEVARITGVLDAYNDDSQELSQ
jgi:hypothetical protein